jgi:hypothetical protein
MQMIKTIVTMKAEIALDPEDHRKYRSANPAERTEMLKFFQREMITRIKRDLFTDKEVSVEVGIEIREEFRTTPMITGHD